MTWVAYVDPMQPARPAASYSGHRASSLDCG